MGKLFNLYNIYVFLWIISFFQNSFGVGSAASLIVSIPQMTITIYCVIKLIMQYKIKGAMLYWVLFFVLLFIYGLFSIMESGSSSFFTVVTASVGPILAFYYLGLRGLITDKQLKLWFVVFLIVCTYGYFDSQAKLLQELSNNYRFEEVTNNASYLFVGLLPFVFLLKDKPLFQYASLAYILYFSVIGLKRGAIIIAALMLLWFVFNLTKLVNNNKRFVVIILCILLIAVGSYYIFQFYNASDYFQSRVESTIEGDSSRRDVIYSSLWSHFLTNNNILELLFGGGAFYTQSITGGSNAHNDWLELLIDCGVLGAFTYLLFWINYICDILKSKSNFMVYCILVSCFIFFFLRSVVSMGFSNMPFHTSMIMGYCFACLHKRFKPL